MAGRKEATFDKACDVVASLFPYHELSVRRLMRINESFREICVDYFEAQHALLLSSQAAGHVQGAEGNDWKEIVDRLHSDLSQALEAYEASLQHVRR